MYNNIHISIKLMTYNILLNTKMLNIKKNQFDNGRLDIFNEL